MLKQLLLFVFLLQISNAADCPICPTGGIWSEWTSTGVCATTCGACSNLNYTRTCLSDGLKNCACVGEPTTTMLCNTIACNYPRGSEAPCCNGSPVEINNFFHCTNATKSAPAKRCCPTGGVWTEWSSWGKSRDKIEWNRTRKCLSGGYNCACVGESEQTKFECPCTPMTAFPTGNTACSGLTKKVPYTIQKPFMEPTTCTTRFSMENSNFRQSFYYKNDKLGREVTTGGWLDKDGNCQIAEFPTGSQDTNGAFYRLGFHCNLTSGAWYNSWANTEILPCYLPNSWPAYDINMKDVVSFAQFY
ncbi:uncharacterized protein CELE_Y64G10A.1 [Caenorhabditis elegans]|uniref:Uncharacterized protein n=1 Tax=Caenorhabditis elegans TaxID=6239 RepID=Q9U1V8_CAEEL|nr:Uncharacterized protein CELE_Y64G10A.1 [Caenorhabditis elegans]CAB57909.2 Uncharacterized protein CELE_Y64G10A.1 [Caenorhabditis elegans]|eukprot:NP_502732.2 Uncharacterized protein CELE_Y64G10A.1 [Caenorhabditis elegans]